MVTIFYISLEMHLWEGQACNIYKVTGKLTLIHHLLYVTYSMCVTCNTGKGNGNSSVLAWQDRGSWWAKVHGIAKSSIWLSDQTTPIICNNLILIESYGICTMIIFILQKRRLRQKEVKYLVIVTQVISGRTEIQI